MAGCFSVDPKVLANIRKITSELRAKITSVAVPPGSPGQPGSMRADCASRRSEKIISPTRLENGNFIPVGLSIRGKIV